VEDLARSALAHRDTGSRAVVARAVALDGFGSRRLGETALIDALGLVTGRLLGGAADEALVAAAGQQLSGAAETRLVDVRIGEDAAVTAGLACGGSARLLVQDLSLVPTAWWEARLTRRPAALLSPLGGAPARVVTDRDGPDGGLLADGASRTEVVEPEGGPVSVIEVFWPTTRAVVIGAAELASALRGQAGLLGWETVLDDGTDPAGAAALAGGLGPADALIVLTHDPEVATPALAAGLRSAGFVGALGSRTTQANRRARLRTAGLDEATVGRLHGPVGLDLGARTPEEQALAICAEIVASRGGRGGAPLTGGAGPING